MSINTPTILLYNPNDDGEWPIHEPSDKCETCDLEYKWYLPNVKDDYVRNFGTTYKHFCDDCNETFPVTEVLCVSDREGHYQSAAFIREAVDVLKHDGVIMTLEDAQILFEYVDEATTYYSHGGGVCPEDTQQKDMPVCVACEFIHETSDAVEAIMAEHGYIVMRGVGFADIYIYKRVEH